MMATRKSRSSSIQNDSSFESDNVFESSPTNTLQRGASISPNSAKDQSTWAKFRRSLMTGKYEKMKQQWRDAKTENEALRDENDKLLKENLQLKRGVVGILGNNPFHLKNLQIGDNYTMINSTDDSVTKSLEELEDLVTKLTDTVEKIYEERTKLEQELQNNKMLLSEIQETLADYSKKCEQKTKIDSKSFTELKTLLVELQSDRSDRQVVSDFIEELLNYLKQRMVVDFVSLPPKVQTGITRLVNKFGNMQWQEFASRVGLNPQNIDYHPQGSDQSSGRDSHVGTPLDKDSCAKIMAEWVKVPDHTASVFMEHLNNIERERTEEAKQRFKLSVIKDRRRGRSQLKHKPSTVSHNSGTSTDSTPSYKELMRMYASQQLGEQRTQTAHAVELCQMVLDKIEPMRKMMEGFETMKEKVDILYDAHDHSSETSLEGGTRKFGRIEKYV